MDARALQLAQTIDGQLTAVAADGEIPAVALHPQRDAASSTWVQDGRCEHTSAASCARAALDEMTLEATQRLIQAALAAPQVGLDRVDARAEPASDVAEVRLHAGSLPLSHNFGSVSDSRAGDPAAIALTMLEEGRINESLAAAEASVAARGRTEPRTRSALRLVAAAVRPRLTRVRPFRPLADLMLERIDARMLA